MITYEKALAIILRESHVLGTELVALDDLLGRTLATATISPLDLPIFDNSAVDGYGIRARDTDETRRVAHEIAAGQDPRSVSIGAGEAVRIFTGSPIPEGVDTVVMQEDTRREGDCLHLETTIVEGQNLRRRGEEVRAGTEVLPTGMVVTPPVLSLIANIGNTSAPAWVRPRVAIVGTGTELAAPGSPLNAGQIYESITPGLRAAITGAGGQVASCRIVSDDPAVTESAMLEALKYDVVVTCGGVSVGDHDLIKPTLAALGVEERIWRVAIRPGKPFYFGIGPAGQRVFGLPGNPVSALVTFFLFVRPALLAMVGREAEPSIEVPLARACRRAGDRDDFLRAKLVDGRADPYPAQESHMLTALAMADVLLRFPANTGPYAAGEVVEAFPLSW